MSVAHTRVFDTCFFACVWLPSRFFAFAFAGCFAFHSFHFLPFFCLCLIFSSFSSFSSLLSFRPSLSPVSPCLALSCFSAWFCALFHKQTSKSKDCPCKDSLPTPASCVHCNHVRRHATPTNPEHLSSCGPQPAAGQIQGECILKPATR